MTSPDGLSKPKRGRRVGAGESKSAILDSARRLFAEHGYDGTSLRQVARLAGVDPAMIHHYFAGKEELFSQSVELPADPDVMLAGLAETAPEHRGEFVVNAVLRLWEGPAQARLVAFARGTLGSTVRTALLRDVVGRLIIARVTAGLPGAPTDVALRGSLAASQVVGLMMVRYVVRLEPLASASPGDVVRMIAPTIQRYLTGDITGVARPGVI